jgi:hypothetical protein
MFCFLALCRQEFQELTVFLGATKLNAMWHIYCNSTRQRRSLNRPGRRCDNMKRPAKTLFLGLALLALNACAATPMDSPLAGHSDLEIFRVGELEVRLYQDSERMSRDLPPSLAMVSALRIGSKQLQVLGYYDEPNKRIYSINDARVLLHEFKHYLEPHWRHEIGAHYLDAAQPDAQSACIDCAAPARTN